MTLSEMRKKKTAKAKLKGFLLEIKELKQYPILFYNVLQYVKRKAIETTIKTTLV